MMLMTSLFSFLALRFFLDFRTVKQIHTIFSYVHEEKPSSTLQHRTDWIVIDRIE